MKTRGKREGKKIFHEREERGREGEWGVTLDTFSGRTMKKLKKRKKEREHALCYVLLRAYRGQ